MVLKNVVAKLKSFHDDKKNEDVEYVEIFADFNGIDIPLSLPDKTAKGIVLKALKSEKGGNG